VIAFSSFLLQSENIGMPATTSSMSARAIAASPRGLGALSNYTGAAQASGAVNAPWTAGASPTQRPRRCRSLALLTYEYSS
jgi:hypothetical protein